MTTLNRGQKAAADVSALLRSRNPLIWIVTREEARVEGYLAQAAAAAAYVPRFWDVAQGVTELDGTQSDVGAQDPDETMKLIRDRAEGGSERGVWIMRDLPAWITGPAAPKTLRQLRNVARLLPGVP